MGWALSSGGTEGFVRTGEIAQEGAGTRVSRLEWVGWGTLKSDVSPPHP